MLATSLQPLGVFGTSAAREAAAALLSRTGWAPDPQRLLFAGNGRQAIAAAIAALVPVGERLEVEPRTYPVVKAIAARLGVNLGFDIAGSVGERYLTCGTANCRCKAGPTQRHGPYIEYTRKLAGKTTGRRLTPEQAAQYRAWIANRRILNQIIAEMDELSHQAARLLTNPSP